MGVVKGKKTNEEEPTSKGIGSSTEGTRAIGALTEPQSAIGAIGSIGGGSLRESPELAKWMKDDMWGQPAWLANLPLANTKSIDRNYEDYLQNSLRWRYMRLEGDFRTALNNFYGTSYLDVVTGLRIVDFLQSAKQTLEQGEFDTLGAKNLLDMIDQYMVWLYPPHVAFSQANALLGELKAMNHPLSQYLENEITKSGTDLDAMRAALDKVKDVLNQETQTAQLNRSLQIERLKLLLKWGTRFLVVMLVFVPMILKIDVKVFEGTILGKFMPELQPWFSIFAIGVIGAAGAFLSGLMQIRKSKINLDEFKESVVQFKLRPLVGAIFALIVAALLSWNLIAGIEITNAGVFVLISFLCGFSERFFLGLLKIDDEGNSTREQGAAIVAAPQNAKVITPEPQQ